MIYRMVCEESRARRGAAAAHLPSFTSSGHLCHSLTPRASSVRACDRNSQATGCKQAVMLNQMMLRVSRKTEMKMSNLLSCGVLSAERGQRDSRRVFKAGARGDCSHNGTILVPKPRWGTMHSAFYRSLKEKVNHVMLNL